MVRTGTTGTGFAKFGFWLAGYYDDFQGSRCIADDGNTPSADGVYDALSTHHGNVMNGEATLNPRYRWSVRDRANNSEFSSSSNYLLLNDGIARWATTDTNRLSKGLLWEGRSQLQFPSGWAHPNRLRYDKAATASIADTYITFSSSGDTSSRYIVPLGDTDASFGRKPHYTYQEQNWEDMSGHPPGYPSTGSAPDFMQTAHLTGVWMGERIQTEAYQTGSASAYVDNPERIFQPIKSKAGKPFLCVQTYMNELDDNRLNNAGTPSGAYRPVIAYSGSLNSRGDGDYFGIRMATHSMNGNPVVTPTGLATNADSSVPPEYVIKVGFPKNTTFGTTGSGGGTPAINWTIRPDGGHGLSDVVPFYHMIWDAGTASSETEPWFDLDFKIDYTNNKFKVYHDGTEVTATNATAGAYSSGYTLNNNTQTSAAFKANELTGWEMFVTNYNSGTVTQQKKAQMNTLIDRAALYRPLTDHPDKTVPAPVNSWRCNMPANGISSGSITVLDDNSTISLTPLFTDSNISDWRVLLFNENIDRPLWSSVIEKMSIRQKASDRTRELVFSFRDSLSLLDRQIATWEIGQIGFSSEDVINARTDEVSLLSDMMYLGAKRMQASKSTIGYEADTNYNQLHNQRTDIDSGLPIQMYNNEDIYGPNNVENEWLGYPIVGFSEKLTSGVTVPIVIMEKAGSGYSASGSGDVIEIFGSDNYDGSRNAADVNVGVSDWGAQQTIRLSGLTTYVPNTSANLFQMSTTAPSTYNGASSSQLSVWLSFSSKPYRTGNVYLEIGDYITVPETESTTKKGPFKALAFVEVSGFFHVLTDRRVISSSAFTNASGTSFKYSLDRGYTKPTSPDLSYRASHAVWMRDLPLSPWFQKHFGVINKTADATGTITAAVTTTDIRVKVDGALIAQVTNAGGVAQITDADGFVDTFTYTGTVEGAGTSGNDYLLGVSGLSKDHLINSTIEILTTATDYKHCWVLWADMRNNGDANADGGVRKNRFGLLKPTRDNYEIGMVFTDQFNDEGGYDEYTSLKIGEDLDIWEINAENDPSTGGDWSKPLVGATYQMANNGGSSITNNGGKARIEGPGSSGSNFAVGDHVYIMDSVYYNGFHKIASISSNQLTLETLATNLEPYDATFGTYYRKCGGSDANAVTTFADWEDKAGAFIVVDSAKFFNLNTFANYGTTGQDAGGNTDLGDFSTEYYGFPVLMDNYWRQAAASHETSAAPLGNHKNFRRWLVDTAQLNRSIMLNDKVIETKPSVSSVARFADDGFGKIIATRNTTKQNATEEVYWYAYRSKLDTSVTETATSSGANTGTIADPLTIVCSAADFVNDGVKPGMRVRNVTAKWVAQISSVTTTTIVIANTSINKTGGQFIYQETGSIRSDVQIGDVIDVPQQLSEVYIESDSGSSLDSETAYTRLMGILADDTQFTNGSGCTLELATTAGTTGLFDKVLIGASTGATAALRFMMQMTGWVEGVSSGTYWMHDKMRAMWSVILSDTWLAQANAPLYFDISTIPQMSNMTTDGTNSNKDSFGSIYDARGGKTLFNTLREASESTGFGFDNATRLPMTYQIGRDNKVEIRPAYNNGEAITRDNLMVSSMDANMAGQISNVRVYYNNGASFIDYPEATLNQTYRWKIIEQPTITNSEEAEYVAKEEYSKANQKSIAISGEIIRDLDDEDKMLKGRYGYIVDASRNMERGAVGAAVFGPPGIPRSNSFNYSWSGQNGCLFPGSVNALDGNMKANGSDSTYKRERYGAGYYDQQTGSIGQTDTYDDNFWWWGANSLAHAVQIVDIPTGCPLSSNTTGEDLRVWVALKDGQSGTNIDNAQFTIGISDCAFNKTPGAVFTNYYSQPTQFAPSYAATVSSFSTVDVAYNGFYEIIIPTGYWSTARPTDPKITVSVNMDYLKALVRRRCGDPTSSSILHNSHDITELKSGAWSNHNPNSIFPIGCHKYDKMSGAYGTRYVWYGSRLHVVEDLRWRPATTVTYTDSGLGLSNEPLVINKINWSVTERNIEKLTLSLERDQTKSAGGLSSFLFPNVARGRSYNPGGQPSSPPPEKPSVPPQGGAGGRGGKPDGSGAVPEQGTTGPIGTSGYKPSKVQGGMFSTMSKGGFTQTFGANNTTAGLHNKIKGKMKLNGDGLSNNQWGILGQPKPVPATSIQKGIDGLDSAIKPASAGATQTSEGWVFPGLVDPDSSDSVTHEHTITSRVPEDVADETISISSTVSLGGTDAQRATLSVVVECEETGASVTRSLNVSANTDKVNVTLLSSTPLNGADVGGNNIKVTISRTPNSDVDDAINSTLVLHSLKVNFQRSSSYGRDFSRTSFNPY